MKKCVLSMKEEKKRHVNLLKWCQEAKIVQHGTKDCILYVNTSSYIAKFPSSIRNQARFFFLQFYLPTFPVGTFHFLNQWVAVNFRGLFIASLNWHGTFHILMIGSFLVEFFKYCSSVHHSCPYIFCCIVLETKLWNPTFLYRDRK